MNRWNLVSAYCAVLLSACATTGTTPGVAPGSGGGSPARVTLTCDMNNVAADTCEPKGGSGKYVCHAYVGKTSQWFVYPGIITVPQDARDVTIVWHLGDQRWSFQDRNDGPFDFRPNGTPFTDRETPTDHEGGPPAGGNSKNFRIKFTPPTSGGYSYKYSLKFRAPGEVVCDPTITSSSN